MLCKELMVRDWCCDKHGLFPMQITNVGDDYAYATFEGHEGDPWEFDDKDVTNIQCKCLVDLAVEMANALMEKLYPIKEEESE